MKSGIEPPVQSIEALYAQLPVSARATHTVPTAPVTPRSQTDISEAAQYALRASVLNTLFEMRGEMKMGDKAEVSIVKNTAFLEISYLTHVAAYAATYQAVLDRDPKNYAAAQEAAISAGSKARELIKAKATQIAEKIEDNISKSKAKSLGAAIEASVLDASIIREMNISIKRAVADGIRHVILDPSTQETAQKRATEITTKLTKDGAVSAELVHEADRVVRGSEDIRTIKEFRDQVGARWTILRAAIDSGAVSSEEQDLMFGVLEGRVLAAKKKDARAEALYGAYQGVEGDAKEIGIYTEQFGIARRELQSAESALALASRIAGRTIDEGFATRAQRAMDEAVSEGRKQAKEEVAESKDIDRAGLVLAEMERRFSAITPGDAPLQAETPESLQSELSKVIRKVGEANGYAARLAKVYDNIWLGQETKFTPEQVTAVDIIGAAQASLTAAVYEEVFKANESSGNLEAANAAAQNMADHLATIAPGSDRLIKLVGDAQKKLAEVVRAEETEEQLESAAKEAEERASKAGFLGRGIKAKAKEAHASVAKAKAAAEVLSEAADKLVEAVVKEVEIVLDGYIAGDIAAIAPSQKTAALARSKQIAGDITSLLVRLVVRAENKVEVMAEINGGNLVEQAKEHLALVQKQAEDSEGLYGTSPFASHGAMAFVTRYSATMMERDAEYYLRADERVENSDEVEVPAPLPGDDTQSEVSDSSEVGDAGKGGGSAAPFGPKKEGGPKEAEVTKDHDISDDNNKPFIRVKGGKGLTLEAVQKKAEDVIVKAVKEAKLEGIPAMAGLPKVTCLPSDLAEITVCALQYCVEKRENARGNTAGLGAWSRKPEDKRGDLSEESLIGEYLASNVVVVNGELKKWKEGRTGDVLTPEQIKHLMGHDMAVFSRQMQRCSQDAGLLSPIGVRDASGHVKELGARSFRLVQVPGIDAEKIKGMVEGRAVETSGGSVRLTAEALEQHVSSPSPKPRPLDTVSLGRGGGLGFGADSGAPSA